MEMDRNIRQEDLDNDPHISEARSSNDWLENQLEQLRKYHPDLYTHSLRVSYVLGKLADQTDLDSEERQLVTQAALLHDIGKTEIPPEILEKEVLSPEDRQVVNEHVRHGYEIVKSHLPQVAAIIAGHHEFQENPYPRRNNRDADERVKKMQSHLAIADSVDALMSERPYKTAWTPEQTKTYLLKNFDENLIDVAIAARSRIIL